jgi:hypothetical protein
LDPSVFHERSCGNKICLQCFIYLLFILFYYILYYFIYYITVLFIYKK